MRKVVVRTLPFLLLAAAAPAPVPFAGPQDVEMAAAATAVAVHDGRPRAPVAAATDGRVRLTLDVLTFNALLRPVLPEGQGRRAPLMADRLAGHDVLLLQEVYSDRHRRTLLRGLARAYPHCTRVLGRDRGFRQDGGVVVCSRWPIEREEQRRFGDLCAGSDCLADKGVLYARIRKEGRRVHVLATHLQSGRAEGRTRARQLAVVRGLIDDLALPADEPVLIGGDLNIDRADDGDGGAFAAMARVLGAVHPPPPDGGRHAPTYDPVRNPLARGAGAGRTVDYVLYSAAHRKPAAAFNAVRPITAADGRPLSDHFAVHGRFVFEPEPPRSAAAGRENPPADALGHGDGAAADPPPPPPS